MTKCSENEWQGEKDRRARNRKARLLYEQISKKLLRIMSIKGISQADILKTCRENGYPIAQSALSKILSYPKASSSSGDAEEYEAFESEPPYSITLANFLQICKALEVNPSEILDADPSIDLEDLPNQPDVQSPKRFPLIINPSEDEFKGYQGLYHCYFFPTISSETQLLYGTLNLEPSPMNDYCKATFNLNTNKCDDEGKTIYKKYTGKLAISPRMSSCYCLLENKRIGELCFVVFRHMYLNNESLKCRIAVAATASAGDNRRPTIHRILISSSIIPNEKMEILKAQLLLNSSDIFISAANLEKLRNQENPPLPQQVAALFDTTIPKEEYYKLSEFQIRGIDIPLKDRLHAICMLRNASTSPKYNKVGSKADELIFNYLTELFESSSPEE